MIASLRGTIGLATQNTTPTKRLAITEADGLPVDSYVIVNGSVSYSFLLAGGTKAQAFIRFFNLLDDEHKEHPNGDSYGLILTGGVGFDW